MLKAFFSPSEQPALAIINLIKNAKKSIKICVFTISDNDIVEHLKNQFLKGIDIKIITDNQKIYDLGSDIRFLATLGIAVKIDNLPSHMHHKFAIFDDKIVLTGSYNWTKSAKQENYENIVISDNRKLVKQFLKEFNRLWNKFDFLKVER